VNAAFFDTNMIVYAADLEGERKSFVARELFKTRMVVVSTQVMMETYGALRRKLGFEVAHAQRWIDSLADETVIGVESSDVAAAIVTANRFQISHWDAMILQSAQKSGVDLIYTEDLNHGQMYGPVRVCNPFIEDFLA
jgi:predicted nucleic acid-binding protein